jgi:hypothetical protein
MAAYVSSILRMDIGTILLIKTTAIALESTQVPLQLSLKKCSPLLSGQGPIHDLFPYELSLSTALYVIA